MSATSVDARFWDGVAEKYAAKPVSDLVAFERKKAITRDALRPTSTVLEIGCGTGSLALEMSPLVEHVHAMDISAEMIRIAREKKAEKGVTNVTFHVGTLDERHPFTRDQFHDVWAYSVLHLVADRRRLLEEIFTLLRPGGSFISSNVCLGDTWVPYAPIITVMRWFGKAPPVYSYGRATFERELREIGFVDVEERDVGASKQIAFVVARKPA